MLSELEMARLQTFPDCYHIVGTHNSVTRQVGNAVPPAIGELLGKSIMNQFFNKELDTSLKLTPRSSGAPPKAHRRCPVPARFKEMAGNPEAHPGHGNGPRAVALRA